MLLKDLLYKVAIRSVVGSTNVSVDAIMSDSRIATKNSVFIAVKGTEKDGHEFIDKAVDAGSSVMVCEQLPKKIKGDIIYVQVEDSALAVAIMSHNFYHQPSEKIKLIGITGTNGKTTIATLLYQLFSSLGYKCGLISTVENKIGEKVIAATHTTPDAIQLNELLNQMVEEKCSHVFMENSSHAIQQQRSAGLKFSGAIFSNITHDHLDYHKTFENYINVKKQFFDSLSSDAFAISNADDKRGVVMLQNSAAQKYFYSLKTVAAFKGKILENRIEGLQMLINDQDVHFRMIGEFNAYNLLAVYAAAICLGEDKQDVLKCLSLLKGAEGRFDYLISKKDKVIAIIDYAHTPDALLNVLSTINKLKHRNEAVITVMGCGGDRDKTKRPLMAAVACKESDRVILTSDNPRSEDPLQIIKDMEEGVKADAKKKCISIVDRREAIKVAVSIAKGGDIVLVAGKGHEKYQIIKGVKSHFDDKKVVKEMFEIFEK
ncbi:MAG: UDP-N-acetylmuramoyl-L-alanyl-D-glutamate--2,6-diaminopimelate ligase [Chitinophagaceae bacterium]|nr:MAG: UDP-N-acetylmuramoyl-L-alanyl-D-glutamate--2,6-diaminopimelate ligase [Chitinophagaceae bacterium]